MGHFALHLAFYLAGIGSGIVAVAFGAAASNVHHHTHLLGTGHPADPPDTITGTMENPSDWGETLG